MPSLTAPRSAASTELPPALAMLYARAQELRGPFTLSSGAHSFEARRASTERRLASQLESLDNVFVRHARTLQSQQLLHGACVDELSASIEAMDADPDCAYKIRRDVPSLMRQLSDLHAALVGELVEVVEECVRSAEEQQAELAARVSRAEGETSELLEAAEQLEKQARHAAEERAALIRMHDAHDAQLKAQLVAVQQQLAEAQRQLQKAPAHAPARPPESRPPLAAAPPPPPAPPQHAQPALPPPPPQPPQPQPTRHAAAHVQNGAGDITAAPPASFEAPRAREGSNVAGAHADRTPQTSSPRQSGQYSSQSKVSARSSVGGGSTQGAAKRGAAALAGSGSTLVGGERTLSLKQMRELIDELYASKTKHDQKCADAKLPRETIEMHLYTFLNTKYGLKSLIAEYANAVLDGIRRYSAEDNDVAVFSAMLRNEIDEEFRFVQKQLKHTVLELLRVYLKGKFPLKRDAEINVMLQQRASSYILEEEWTDIVKYMYNADDAAMLIDRVKELSRLDAGSLSSGAAPSKGAVASRRSLERSTPRGHKLPYSKFVKVLLDFQMAGHQRFLSTFVKEFRNVDVDGKGVLDETAFRSLLSRIAPSKDEAAIRRLLNIVDPHNRQQMTFSDCVATLSTDLVAMLNSPV
ncbi:hypothetical protein AB1Y20_005279 [Prymnesium parvum]|uniref:EF-hand domain-containing protein n=1 Tax=Prymnesium parvum TaxID=97485 RepID=A0AB34J3P4_PRYPA